MFSDVSLSLGPAGNPVVQVSNGEGEFTIITGGGIAGRVSVDVAVNVPGVTLSGSFSLEINTTAAVYDGIAVGIKVTGEDVVLGIAGQRLTGSFTVEQNPSTKEVGLALDMLLELGNGTQTFISVGVEGALLITPQGMALDITGTVELGQALEDRLAGRLVLDNLSVRLQLNTGRVAVDRTILLGTTPYVIDVPIGPYLMIQAGTSAAPVSITVMGQRISGVFTFAQTTSANGVKVARIGFTDVEVFLGDPGANLTDTSDDAGLLVSNGTGALLLMPGGIAGSFRADVSLTEDLEEQLGGSFSSTVTVQINTLTTAVDDEVVVDGTTLPLVLPRGPYLRASVENARITFAEYRLEGSFLFEKATDYGADNAPGGTLVGSVDNRDSQVLTIAMVGLTLSKLNATTSAYEAFPLSNLTGVLMMISRGSSRGFVLNLSAELTDDFLVFESGQVLTGKVNTTTVDSRPGPRGQRPQRPGAGRRRHPDHPVRLDRGGQRGLRLRWRAGDPRRLRAGQRRLPGHQPRGLRRQGPLDRPRRHRPADHQRERRLPDRRHRPGVRPQRHRHGGPDRARRAGRSAATSPSRSTPAPPTAPWAPTPAACGGILGRRADLQPHRHRPAPRRRRRPRHQRHPGGHPPAQRHPRPGHRQRLGAGGARRHRDHRAGRVRGLHRSPRSPASGSPRSR